MLAAAVGSAVGLGNIWKFPYEAGTNGGDAFLVVYLICVLLLGFPALITELSIGRMAKTNPIDAFSSIVGNKCWNFVGAMGVLSAFLILCFYMVVAGWSLEYIYQTFATSTFEGMNASALGTFFNDFAFSSYRPYVWLTIFIIATFLVIKAGIEKGIEKASKILMPALFVIIIILSVYVAFLPGNAEGYQFYLNFDVSKITPSVALSALGQSFFSLSLASGVLLVYGSYMNEGNIVNTSLQISLFDTMIAVMAGFMIFPAVFAYGIEPSEGPSLAYIALPAVFSQMRGGMIISLLFFSLLTIGAFTSTISLHEVLTSCLADKLHITRFKSNIIVVIMLIIGAYGCCYSLTENSLFYFGGRSLFTWFNDITSEYFLPLGGMVMSIFFGWFVSKQKVKATLTEFGMKPKFFPIYFIFVRYLIPLAIMMIMLQQFGMF